MTALDIQAVKRELPDDPAELRKYFEAVDVDLGSPCVKLMMTFCEIAFGGYYPLWNQNP